MDEVYAAARAVAPAALNERHVRAIVLTVREQIAREIASLHDGECIKPERCVAIDEAVYIAREGLTK